MPNITILHSLSMTTPDNTAYENKPSDWNKSHLATIQFNTSDMVGISAGASSQSTGLVQFSNSNQVTFGLSNGTMTASVPGTSSLAGVGAVSLAAAGNTISISGVGMNVSAGTTSNNMSAISFNNANGVSFGLNGSVLTASAAGGAGGGIFAGVSTAGNTAGSTGTVSTGNVVFVGSGPISLSQSTGAAGSAATITINAPATSSLAGVGGVSISTNGSTISVSGIPFSGGVSGGNTSNNSGTVSNQLVLAGGNNITLSGSTNAGGMSVTISGANAGGAQTGISSVAASNTTYTSGGITFTGSNMITVRSTTGQGIVIDATQSNQSAGIYASSQTFGQSSSSTHDARSLSIVGSGGVSVGWSNSSLLISGTTYPAQSNQSDGIYASSQTFGQSSSSTHDARSLTVVGSGNVSVGWSNSSFLISGSQSNQSAGIYGSSQTFGQSSSSTYDARSLSIVGSGGVSVGWSNSSLLISGTTYPAQSNQSDGIYASSQTFGQSSSSTHDARSLTIVGSGNVSVGWSNSSFLISGAQSNQSAGIYASSQTFGQSSSSTYDARSLTVVGSGGVSVGWSNSSLLVSGTTYPAQSNQSAGIYASSQTFGQSSSSTHDARSLTVVGSGGVSVGWSNSSLLISGTTYPAQSNQSAIKGLGASNTGNTAGNTGVSSGIDWVLAGTNNITISESTVGGGPNTLWVSGGAGAGGAAISAGANSQNTGTVNFANSNGVTFGLSNNGTMTASIATSLTNINVSAGTTSNNLSAVVFSNSNSMSFGLSGSTVTGSFSQSNQQLTAYAASNTTQSSSGTYNASSMIFAGAGIASVGVTNGSVVVSVPAGGGAGDGGVFAGVSTAGNTAGSTGTVSTGNFVLVGTGAITLSQSTAAAGSHATVTFSVPQTSSLIGTNGISISTNGSTISVSGIGPNLSAGTTSTNQSNFTFSNSNGVSFGLSSGAGAGVITASVATSLTAINVSAGTTSTNVSALTFVNSNNMSFQINVNGSAGAISASYAYPNFNANNGLVVSTNGLSVTYGEAIQSYFEPPVRGQTSAGTMAAGTLYMQPFMVAAPVSAYRLHLYQSYSTQSATTMSITASVSSQTSSSGTASWGMTGTVGLYSRLSTGTDNNSSRLISFYSNSYSYSVGASLGVTWSTNVSSATGTYTWTVSVGYPQNIDSAGGLTTSSNSSSFSTTFSSTSNAQGSFATTTVMSFGSACMSGMRPLMVPFATSLTPGEYWLGHNFSTANASNYTRLDRAVNVEQPNIVCYSSNTTGYLEIGLVATVNSSQIQPGWGSYSATQSTTSTFELSKISGNSQLQTWFNMMAQTK